MNQNRGVTVFKAFSTLTQAIFLLQSAAWTVGTFLRHSTVINWTILAFFTVLLAYGNQSGMQCVFPMQYRFTSTGLRGPLAPCGRCASWAWRCLAGTTCGTSSIMRLHLQTSTAALPGAHTSSLCSSHLRQHLRMTIPNHTFLI